MKNSLSRRVICPGLLAVAVTGSSTTSFAGSPALGGIVAEADNAESVFAAPAGMSRLEGRHMTVQGMVVRSFASFDVDESKTAVEGGDPDNGEDPILIPSIYYVRQLDERWHAGISFTVPTGFGSDYGSDWSGRYESVDFSLVYVALTPAIAYRWNEKLSFGAGLGINYTSETSEVKFIQPIGDDGRDGKITSDLDGVGLNVTLSMLYEFTPRTRAGLAWTSDSDADLEGNVRLRNLNPAFDEVATELGIKNINTEITNTLPQRVLAGMYHEFSSGNYFTLDGMWMKFSDFSVSNIEVNGNDVNVQVPEIYDDFYAITTGMGFPASGRLTYKIGAMYISPLVDDDDRTFSIRVDEMWGIGAGVSYQLAEQRVVDLNATLINTGEAPVDTANQGAVDDRVAGENDDPWAVLMELTYHF